MRVAAIDCGTNAIRLLIADVLGGQVRDVWREMRTVRLGEGVDQFGEFTSGALERTFAACDVYAALIAEYGAVKLRFVATSASRDVANRDVFTSGIQERLGITPEVITGEQEADLSFRGALQGLPDIARPVLVVDIGGGSTEFVLGTTEPQFSASVNMGCVRMTERHVRHDPPSPSEIAAMLDDVNRMIEQAAEVVPFDQAVSLVGLAGSVTTVAAMALNLPTYDADRIHGARISRAEVLRVTQELVAMSGSERAALPFMHPGRVDVIASGASILSAIMVAVGAAEVVASEHDILDGMASALANA
jgi:exopolyphosphatase / guanosine-5'-triphosphate,3'-diphosphate pyrophosphatase